MKEKTYVKKRKWLNPIGHWNTGAISYAVVGDKYSVDVDLSIWDCSRKISLDLSVSDEKDAKNVNEKINILIESLLDIKANLGIAYNDFLENKEEDDE